jgi:putative FmdB family regulatory protein
MPTYAYACKECGHRFDAVQSFADPTLTESRAGAKSGGAASSGGTDASSGASSSTSTSSKTEAKASPASSGS